jgi:tetratricopeptide (TPR) repeat protein
MVISERLRIRDHVQSGRYEEALSVSVHASRAEVNRAHIRLLSRHRDCVDTRELLNHAKSRIAGESDIEKGRRFIRIGLKEEALALLMPALEDGGDPDDYLVVGQTLEQAWRLEAALPFFEKAAELRGNAYDHLWHGTVLERLERYNDAIREYERAVALRGSADDHRSLGGVLLKNRRLEEAGVHLIKAVELGDDLTSPQLLQVLKAHKNKAKLKRLFQVIGALLSKSAEEVPKKSPSK